MHQILLVGIGGFIGSACRYIISGTVHSFFPFALIPYGTLAVNASGCFIIGLLGGIAETRQVFSSDMRMFLFIGVLGGFTTFSSFAFETLSLVRDADYLRASSNVILQLTICLILVWIGNSIGRLL